MFLLVVTWILTSPGASAQAPGPAPALSISTEKIAIYKSMGECRKAAEAFAVDPADHGTGVSLSVRTVCAPVPDGDSVAG